MTDNSKFGAGGFKRLARKAGGLMLAVAMLTGAGAGVTMAQNTKIVVAGSDGITSAAPFFAAEAQGYFKEAGLDVTFLMMGGSGAAMAAAIKAGDIDVAMGGAAQYMTFIANGAVTGKLIGELTDNNYAILGGKGIKNVAELKGKKFGISSHNAADHVYAMAVLAQFGIKPNEMEWIPLGNAPARLSALISDNIQGTQITITSLPQKNFDLIISNPDQSPVPFVGSAIFATDKFVASNKPALRKLLDAIGKGADWIRKNPKEAVQICTKSGAALDRCEDTVRVGITSTNPYMWPNDSRLNVKAIEAMIPEVMIAAPKGKGMKLADFVDAELAKGRQ